MKQKETRILVTKNTERTIYHLFDGSTNQEQTAVWNRVMKSCSNKNGDWRTYAAVVWEYNNPYDRGEAE